MIKRQEKKILKKIVEFYIGSGKIDSKDVYFCEHEGYMVEYKIFGDGYSEADEESILNYLLNDFHDKCTNWDESARLNIMITVIPKKMRGLSWANRINFMLHSVAGERIA